MKGMDTMMTGTMGNRVIRLMILAGVLLGLAAGAARATETRSLGNTFTKLKEQKSLNIGYFGGSITAGAGASNGAKTSYRALTTAWFREQYPAAQITEINAAIGGTGSNLGAFRCEQDLLSKKPDLVFVEFAVNDGSGPEKPTERAMEGIVRQVWRANPAADIVFINTISQPMYAIYDKGETPKSVQYHHAVAAHYGIPEVQVGAELFKTMKAEGKKWEDFFKDSAHPNDTGYANYEKTIQAFFKAHQSDAEKSKVELGAPMLADCLEHGRLINADALEVPGWTKEKGRNGFKSLLVASTAGTELTYKFNGTAIGVYWLIAPDSGDIEWSIDGGKPQRRSSWDSYAKKYSRANYAVLRDTLAAGEHTLRLKVLGEKQAESTGTAVRIGALMVN